MKLEDWNIIIILFVILLALSFNHGIEIDWLEDKIEVLEEKSNGKS